MTELPAEFTAYTRLLMGEERFGRYLQSFEEETPVSIRLNPKKPAGLPVGGERVAWCRHAYYLKERPNFTFDPLFHAGCYYVQEAASMFLDTVLQQLMADGQPLTALDLCAAPGGKSTLLRAALPEGSVLYSNEPVRNRASILAENMQKWGYPDCVVTNKYPRDYRKSKMKFDVILCDVPCSGEGMFRKDAATIREWSMQNVEKCWRLQREIVSDAWECLNEGGLMVYSTCTFNTKENEENIRWMTEELGAQVVGVEVKPEWNIVGSLLEGFHEPVYRFIPGITKGEGLFLCALRKGGHVPLKPARRQLEKPHTEAQQQADVQCELTYQQALAYLRHEALTLPTDVPRGLVEVTFQGIPLGLAKNIGNRANNLYPKEWRIKTTHIPNDYEAILRHTEQNTDGGHAEG